MIDIIKIDGKEYRLIETVSSLDEGEKQILCADNAGARFVVSQNLWNSLQKTSPETAVHGKSSTQGKISLFLSMFHGREDVYAKRYYNFKSQKSGYVPACLNEWAPGLCDKQKNRCIDCPIKQYLIVIWISK